MSLKRRILRRLPDPPAALRPRSPIVSSRALAEPVEDRPGPAPSGRDRRAAAPDTSQEAQVGNATTPHNDPDRNRVANPGPGLNPPARRSPLRAILALAALASLTTEPRR